MTPQPDPGARLAAAGLQEANPDWLILWGRYDRRFWAFPRFRVPPGTIISASRPADLTAAMRLAEDQAARHPGRPSW